MVPLCPECKVKHDDDGEFHEDCAEAGLEHIWGSWHFANVGTHEIRFCGRCGIMEQQWVET